MFLSHPFKKCLRYGKCALLPRSFDLLYKRVHTPKTLFLSGELEICVFFISYYPELFYKGLIKFNIY